MMRPAKRYSELVTDLEADVLRLASLDRADVRQSRYGIYIHSDAGKQEIDVLAGRAMGVAQRRAELEELYDSVVLGKPLWHDGRR